MKQPVSSPRTMPSCFPALGLNEKRADLTGPFSSSRARLYLLERSLAAL